MCAVNFATALRNEVTEMRMKRREFLKAVSIALGGASAVSASN
ncbi:MAG: hypothetical protein DFNUSKGM_001189, partial [Candidatus Fervidibacter sacchari]